MKLLQKISILSLLLLNGAIAQAQIKVDTLDTTVTRYDVKGETDSIQSLGEAMPTFLSWFEKKYKNFNGDIDSYFLEIGSFSNRTPALPHSSKGYAYQSPRVKHYGPSYKKHTIVWFANGLFDEITNCTDKVRFHEGMDSYRMVCPGIRTDLDKILSVEIVEGDANFHDHIPNLKKWTGQIPVLIYVTYKENCYIK